MSLLNNFKLNLQLDVPTPWGYFYKNYMYFYLYFYLYYHEYIKCNSDLSNQLTFICRLVISIFLLYELITDNPIIVINFIDTFEPTYFNLLEGDIISICDTSLEDGLIKINPWDNPFGEGSSRQGNSGSGGPSGQGPEGGGNYLAFGQSENTRRDIDDSTSGNNVPEINQNMPEVNLPENRLNHHGPRFYFVEECNDGTYRSIEPERYHTLNLSRSSYQFSPNHKLRNYNDGGGVQYLYNCIASDEGLHKCYVFYPDGTVQKIEDKPTILKHIAFHKNHQVTTSYRSNTFISAPVWWSQEPNRNYEDHFKRYGSNKVLDDFLSSEFTKIRNIEIESRFKTSNIYNLLNTKEELETIPKTSNIYKLLNWNNILK